MELFLISVLVLVVDYFIAQEFYSVAQMKGYSQKKYFWLPFLFSICGYLLVIALPVKTITPTAAPQNLPDEQLPDL